MIQRPTWGYSPILARSGSTLPSTRRPCGRCWTARQRDLLADDLDDAWTTLPGDPALKTLRRGDIARFARTGGELLVAPLLAVERGHNIVVPGGIAAIGSVYFLARPHPRPDDIALAIQAINDWAVRQVRGSGREFKRAALEAGTPDLAGLAFRREARRKWNRYLTRQLSRSSLPDEEKISFTWDQLVVMWQVIGTACAACGRPRAAQGSTRRRRIRGACSS